MTRKWRNAKIYLAKLDFCELSTPHIRNEYETDLNTIPQFRRSKILQYIMKEDRYRSFYAWKLLEAVMRIEFSFDIKKEVFIYTPYGKPHFNKNDIHFNLSHSGSVVVCAVDTLPIGVDVEELSSIDLSIASSFFSKKECFDLFDLPESEQISYFYKLWTLKESYIKAEGKGLSIPLNSFTFSIGYKTIIFQGKNEHEWEFLSHTVNAGVKNYQLGVCAHKGRLPNKIIEIPITYKPTFIINEERIYP